jgi:hypothetical protein
LQWHQTMVPPQVLDLVCTLFQVHYDDNQFTYIIFLLIPYITY